MLWFLPWVILIWKILCHKLLSLLLRNFYLVNIKRRRKCAYIVFKLKGAKWLCDVDWSAWDFMRKIQANMNVHLALGVPKICVWTQVLHVWTWQQQGSLGKAHLDEVSNGPDTSILFWHTFVVFVQPGGMSRLDTLRRIAILIITHISTRFRIWRPTSTCFIDLRIQLLIIIWFSSIRILKVEFFHYFPLNSREHLAFREKFLWFVDSLMILRIFIPSTYYISSLSRAYVASLCAPHCKGLHVNNKNLVQ